MTEPLLRYEGRTPAAMFLEQARVPGVVRDCSRLGGLRRERMLRITACIWMFDGTTAAWGFHL